MSRKPLFSAYAVRTAPKLTVSQWKLRTATLRARSDRAFAIASFIDMPASTSLTKHAIPTSRPKGSRNRGWWRTTSSTRTSPNRAKRFETADSIIAPRTLFTMIADVPFPSSQAGSHFQ